MQATSSDDTTTPTAASGGSDAFHSRRGSLGVDIILEAAMGSQGVSTEDGAHHDPYYKLEDYREHEETNGKDDTNSFTESEKLVHKKLWEASNTENLIKGWGEKAAGLRWMHLYSADVWRRADERLNIASVAASSVMSATSFLGSVERFVAKEYVMMFVGVLGIVTVVGQSVSKYYNASRKVTLHENASKQFGHFNRFVATKLSLPRMERGDPREVLAYVLKENERLYNEAIDPHPVAISKYRDFVNMLDKENDAIKNPPFVLPDIINSSFAIDVYTGRPALCGNGNNANGYSGRVSPNRRKSRETVQRYAY